MVADEAQTMAWSQFQARRHSAQQNRACSRRGVNRAPQYEQLRVSVTSSHVTRGDKGLLWLSIFTALPADSGTRHLAFT
jgi:hypothetical protein